MITLPVIALTGGALYASLRLYRQKQPLISQLSTSQGSSPIPSPVPAGAELDQAAVTSADHTPNWLHALRNNDTRQWTMIGLTGTTTVIHLVLGLQGGGVPIFVLNGVGFAALLAGKYLVPQRADYQEHVNDIFLAYTGTTIIAYFVELGVAGLVDPLGMITKAVEVALMGVLWVDTQTLHLLELERQ